MSCPVLHCDADPHPESVNGWCEEHWDALLADVEGSLRMARRCALSDMKRLLAEAENREKDELA